MTHPDKDVEAAGESYAGTSPGVSVIERTHADVRHLLSDYLDGSLEPAQRAQVEQHLDDCAACRAFCGTLKRTIEATGQLPGRRLPAQTRQRIASQLKAMPHSS